MESYSNVVDGLRDKGLLPASYEAVFVSGSLVRGWGNASSDLDISVITTDLWRSTVGETSHVALQPDTIAWESTVVDGRIWEIEYWLDSQVEQTLDKVSWARYGSGQAPWKLLSHDEMSFLERLPDAAAVDRPDWLARRQRQLLDSAHRAASVSHALDYMDGFVEDAVGQCEAGDVESAVLSVRIAFGHAVDALLANAGHFGSKWPKWRARRFRAAGASAISFEEYWNVETMRDYDPAAPCAWVERVILLCRRIAMSVDI